MLAGDLTSIESVKAFLKIADTASDTLLATFVRAMSRRFRKETKRDLLYASYAETRDGNGTKALEPRQYPVVSVSSVKIDNTTIPAQPAYNAGDPPPYGWVLVDDRVEIESGWLCGPPLDTYAGDSQPPTFRRGNGNVLLSYIAGFKVTDEAQTIPGTASYQITVSEPYVSDLGVKFSSDGTPLTKVASAPAAGQYSVAVSGSAGVYTFNSADANKGVLISYANVPADIEMAVIDMVAYAFKGKDHIGQRSKMVGNEPVTYMVDDIAPSAKSVIELYKRVSI